MGILSSLAVLLAAAAGGIGFAPRPGVVRLRAVASAHGAGRLAARSARPPGSLTGGRRRAMAACIAVLGSAAVVGGVGGWLFGLVVGAVAWVGLGRLEPAAVVRQRQHIAAAVPLAAELLAAAVGSGAPPERAAEVVGRAIGGPLGDRLGAAAAASRVGADPRSSWTGLLEDPAARAIGRAMLRSAARGVSSVPVLQRVALDARDTARWAAEAKARSVGAKAAAPLGLCFLPAFVLVGIVPLVATLGMPLLP
ncbi:MAG TPA: type II secretion system F family protein [Jiangellales bacterium]|nr:type II secretion system F family protein [Jiangellales bacterium]